MQVLAISPPLCNGHLALRRRGTLGTSFHSFFFSFFERGEKGVENQAAWLRAFKQIKSCGKFIE